MSNTSDQHIADEWHEACGIFGIWNHPNASKLVNCALYALQHRGQESAGIAVVDGISMHYHRSMGLVAEAFKQEDVVRLTGHSAIGHVRYSTTGSSCLANAQPLIFHSHLGNLALAHNGNLTNANLLHDILVRQGYSFQSTTDTEVVAHLIIHAGCSNIIDSIRTSLHVIEGGYTFVMLTNDYLIALRDPSGLRPIVLGQLDNAIVVASETCAFDAIGARFIRDIEPGEMVIINNDGIQTEHYAPIRTKSLCTFEYIYFARPDSNLDGMSVYKIRKQLGKALAKVYPVDADLVTGVPDSGIPAAIGYAEDTGIPYEVALIKNHYIGRTFIQPTQKQREQGINLKLNVVRTMVEGRRVVIVDDSLVRGITSSRLVNILRSAGTKEIHLRIASPPVAYPCFYGIDTSDYTKLIAAHKSIDEIAEHIGVDSLAYLSEKEMLQALGVTDIYHHPFCNACFNGHKPSRYTGPRNWVNLSDEVTPTARLQNRT